MLHTTLTAFCCEAELLACILQPINATCGRCVLVSWGPACDGGRGWLGGLGDGGTSSWTSLSSPSKSDTSMTSMLTVCSSAPRQHYTTMSQHLNTRTQCNNIVTQSHSSLVFIQTSHCAFIQHNVYTFSANNSNNNDDDDEPQSCCILAGARPGCCRSLPTSSRLAACWLHASANQLLHESHASHTQTHGLLENYI